MIWKYSFVGITICTIFGFYLCFIKLSEYSNIPVEFLKEANILTSNYHKQNVTVISNSAESYLTLNISTSKLPIPSKVPIKFPKYSNTSKTKKLILFWTGFYNKIWPFEIFKGDALFTNCKYKCKFTRNRSLLYKANAVIFEGLPINNFNNNNLPIRTSKLQNQIWIFQRVESPLNVIYNLSIFDHLINWTMTYRRDSDILWPAATYESIVNKSIIIGHNNNKHLPNPNYSTAQEIMVNKTKLIAWMNSHCSTPSLRENIVTELEKYIEIHDYGNCSKNLTYKCDISHGYSCYKELGKQYKFWLVFENSICKDYVSEKLWEALRFNMVPIVYGYSNTLKDIAIPNSYIDIMKFKSIKELAKYLLYLHENNEEYLKFMEWKKYYRILSVQENIQMIACNLCTKLNELKQKTAADDNSSRNNNNNYSYDSIHKWFNINITTNEFQCNIPRIEKDGRIQLWSVKKS